MAVGIDQDLGTLQRGQPRRLRVPLVPADQHTELCGIGGESLEAQIARREVVFFVVARIIGDMHLAVLARIALAPVEHSGGVVVQARRTPLEQADDDRRIELGCQRSKSCGRRARNRLGQGEVRTVLRLAEIATLKQLRQADQLCPVLRGLARHLERTLEIGLRISPAAHLDQGNRKLSPCAHPCTLSLPADCEPAGASQ